MGAHHTVPWCWLCDKRIFSMFIRRKCRQYTIHVFDA